MTQLSFFDIEKPKPKPTGEILRDKGIKRAVDHAEDIHEGWQVKALDWLYIYAKTHIQFSGEMVRMDAKGILPDPPSLRTWGSVLRNGACRGWIRQVGYVRVTNPDAHKANAALWESNLR